MAGRDNALSDLGLYCSTEIKIKRLEMEVEIETKRKPRELFESLFCRCFSVFCFRP